MKNSRNRLGFLLLALLFLPRHVLAEADGFFADAGLRLRYEAVDWFGTEEQNTDYLFPQKKLQLGVGYKQEWFKFYLQGQYFQLWNLPERGSGIGATYFGTNDGEDEPGGVGIRQGYLQVEHQKLRGQLGRFLYSGGAEAVHPNQTVTWLKNRRISQRLIGPFDYTGGRSFDGARVDYKFSKDGVLTAHYSRPTQGGFETNLMKELTDVDLATLVYTAAVDEEHEGQLFYYYYGDDRGVPKTDNRPQELRAAELEDIQIHTIGGHWVGHHTVGAGEADLLLWGVVQFGDWGNQDHFAGALALEGGYRFSTVPGKPWLRAGYNYGSGDDDPEDNDHTTLAQLLPTGRIYAQTPFYNMQNTHDLFVQGIVSPLAKLTVRTDAHVILLVQDEDLLYSGSGANENRVRFGFVGTPSNGEEYVGTLVDIDVTYQIAPQASVTVYYGHLFGGEVLEQFADEDIDYAFVELNLKLPG